MFGPLDFSFAGVCASLEYRNTLSNFGPLTNSSAPARPGIARIAESHAAMGRLPLPQLSERRLAVGGTDWRLVVGHHVDDRKRKDEKGLD